MPVPGTRSGLGLVAQKAVGLVNPVEAAWSGTTSRGTKWRGAGSEEGQGAPLGIRWSRAFSGHDESLTLLHEMAQIQATDSCRRGWWLDD